jgi:pyruvate dehydrogenase E2 component (dihydrolipoamide acetyltransferase)
MKRPFVLPELGEGIDAGLVVKVLAAPGDEIAAEQAVVELETDKAVLEVPCPFAGVVVEVHVKEGEEIRVGATLVTVETEAENGGDAGATEEAAASEKERAADETAAGGEAPSSKETGAAEQVPAAEEPAAEGESEAAEKAPATEKVPTRARAGKTESRPSTEEATATAPAKRSTAVGAEVSRRPAAAPVAASPMVRRLAREIGVDIQQVKGSGPGGRITDDDVKAHARSSGGARVAAASAEPLPDFSRWGEVERAPLTTIRRRTAERLAEAWATIPHVTQVEDADITDLEALRKRYAARVEEAGGRLTLTAILLKGIAIALQEHPDLNASIDMAAGEIVYKRYYHLGVAVDTERGLLVPVIRDVDGKNIEELALELGELSERGRAGKLSLEEMQGGTFTITNLGGIGGTAFTPIVNPPQVAILGVSRGRMTPVYDRDGATFRPRLLLPLSLSYDHRAVDGAAAIRFLRRLVELLEEPFLLTLEG